MTDRCSTDALTQENALGVPAFMRGCIDLPEEELRELKKLLEKALTGMERKEE